MQLLTYLRMSGLPIGLLFNFRVLSLKDGRQRFVG
jgi:PD-(D/E)XK nuclease superfamily